MNAVLAVVILIVIVVIAVAAARARPAACPAGETCMSSAPPSCPAGQACLPPPAPTVLVRTPGWDYPGSDTPGSPTVTPTEYECATACLASPTCGAYVWITDGTGRCWLKDTVPAPKANGAVVGGLVLSRDAMGQTGACANLPSYAGIDFPGNDHKGMPTAAATNAACAALCQANPACAAYAFEASSQGCWLKWGVSAPSPNPAVTGGVCVR